MPVNHTEARDPSTGPQACTAMPLPTKSYPQPLLLDPGPHQSLSAQDSGPHQSLSPSKRSGTWISSLTLFISCLQSWTSRCHKAWLWPKRNRLLWKFIPEQASSTSSPEKCGGLGLVSTGQTECTTVLILCRARPRERSQPHLARNTHCLSSRGSPWGDAATISIYLRGQYGGQEAKF